VHGVTIAAINVGAQAARVSIDEMIDRYLPVMQSTRDTITSLLV
jgi:IclR family pca regulon transcriptional regulator